MHERIVRDHEKILEKLELDEDFETEIEQFGKNEDGKTILKNTLMTCSEISALIRKLIKEYKAHRIVVKADFDNSDKIMQDFLLDKFAMVLEMDFSQNVPIEFFKSTQQVYMNGGSFVLHCCVIRYLLEVYYLFTVVPTQQHKPELVFLAMDKALNFIQERHGITIKKILRKTDNCAEQYQQGLHNECVLSRGLARVNLIKKDFNINCVLDHAG